MKKRSLVLLIGFLFACQKPPSEWETLFERSKGQQTPSYQDTIDYFKRLDKASDIARLETFAVSPQGREIAVLLIDAERRFTPASARQSGKPVVFIQGAIHPGESAGKDAAMLLARELLIENKHPKELQNLLIAIIPIFNVDGHEQFSRYNRINQIGPEEMGVRVTSTRHNLNRDFMKADTPEMRQWLALYHAWKPDMLIDCHTTDGEDFQYVAAYHIDTHPEFGGAISQWACDHFVPDLLKRCEDDGIHLLPYAGYLDPLQPDKGMQGGVWTPRLSNVYCTLGNRAGFLIEAHSLKDYATRVQGTLAILRSCLNLVAEQRDDLLLAVQAGDIQARGIGQRYDPAALFPLTFTTRSDQGDTLLYRGYRIEKRVGKISGRTYLHYSDEKWDRPMVYFNNVLPKEQIVPPVAYLIPPQWQEAIAVLQAHHIRMFRLNRSLTDSLQTYRFADVTFASWPYEGRQRVDFRTIPVQEPMTFPAGSVYIPLGCAQSRLILHLLEPQAPDALLRWGFFTTIFEQKEYFETYVMEPMAQKMMEEDPQLAAEFARRCANDSAFAVSGQQRLSFFYEKTPYYDRRFNLYPVARLIRRLPEEWLEPIVEQN